jgi:hypothetical protein
VPSASHHTPRLAALALCGALLLGTASGCSTTEEKAEHQQARAKHILEARAARQRKKKHEHDKPGKQGEKGSSQQ